MSFNPRTHTGCDYPIQKEHYSTIYVSIHAPTRGATTDGLQPTLEAVFQSTHPHGVRPQWDVKTLVEYLFQSTHPHGVRHHPVFNILIISICFNPRTHTGCDTLSHLKSKTDKCFNPRTHTGCDRGRGL